MLARSMSIYIIPAMSIVGFLLSLAMPSTSELTSPRFLMIYSWALMTLLVGCWLSFKGLIPIPLWAPAIMLIITAVALPLIKVYFSQ
ncbi:hypothetical protein SAMN04490207_5245 [Pseudomonas gessardii]|uniref:Uncharacterized protein n=1 Tax=Pseudomonas gessardii TaxID=78544 RepID=A0A7Y1MUZ2_9PSED|nr:hypothetical protein [Pseudomonas gessardii]MRU50118.1 hypothetical protein [Pseudomonas gessardii]NNA98894.1 hypothetical protein [Pseudomonas gessardii]ONH46320.1 hypothetical protein BLL38_07160 [Pseudomonas gessardii]SDR33580.1 hypothetical protein SAMN04490207_5245 [Pseudomonas gessardii]